MKLTENNFREYLLKTYAAWLGKNIGVRLGAPVEGWTHQKITETYGHITGYPVSYGIFAADDDTNGPLFFVRCLLEKNDITAEDIGDTFLNYIQEYSGFFWWGGVGVSSEHTAYENLKKGIKAPLSGSRETNGLTIAEQIGGQIFSDCWGYVSGYDPQLARKLAMMASSVTHDENGIQGGIFVAVAICLAYQRKDIREVLSEALGYLDPDMEYYRVCTDIIRFHDENPDDWHDCLQYIHDNYGYDRYPGVCHIIPNSALMIMAMCYGDNDFTETLTMLCESGWDTDCNCGNVGSIMGALVGIEGIEESWITPINDIVNASSCVGCLNIQTISQSAQMFAQLAMKLQGLTIPASEHFSLPYATEGFSSESKLTVRDNSLIAEGSGYLFQHSYYRSADIYDARYDPAFSPLVYPGDTLEYEVQGNECTVFVQDCDRNVYRSEKYDVSERKIISFTVPEDNNMTVNYYGLLYEGGIQIHDVKVRHHARLDIDFHDYPLDFLGPRYEGDYMHNIRGFVPHSGIWSAEKDGLHGFSKEHALITTGHLDNRCAEMEVRALRSPGTRFSLVWDCGGYLLFTRLEVSDQQVRLIEKDGFEKVVWSASNCAENVFMTLKVKRDFARISVYLNDVSFVIDKTNLFRNTGAVGFMIDGPGEVVIQDFKLRSSV